MANEAERAASEQRMGDVYQITVRDKHDPMITLEKRRDQKWKGHFEEILNHPTLTTDQKYLKQTPTSD